MIRSQMSSEIMQLILQTIRLTPLGCSPGHPIRCQATQVLLMAWLAGSGVGVTFHLPLLCLLVSMYWTRCRIERLTASITSLTCAGRRGQFLADGIAILGGNLGDPFESLCWWAIIGGEGEPACRNEIHGRGSKRGYGLSGRTNGKLRV
jgi:hypothetical protein